MYKVTLTYCFKKRPDDDAIQKVWSVVAAYVKGGQLVGHHWVTRGRAPNTICVTGAAHERSGFSGRYVAKCYRGILAELSPLLRKRVTLEWEQFAEDGESCSCSRPSRLVFSPHVVYEASPLRCLDCGSRRPLYRIGRPSEHLDLLQIARQWIGFYWTWMDSGTTEALGWRQLADPTSEFAQMARKRIRRLEKRTRVPVYYHVLTHYRSRDEDPPESTVCPGCGRLWRKLSGERLDCRLCRLFSYDPIDCQLPDWWRPLPRHRSR